MKRKLSKTIACRICGKRLQNLTKHINKFHDMRTEDYKKQFGVDHVMSEGLRAKMSESGTIYPKKQPYVPMDRERLLKALKKISRNRPNFMPLELREEWTSLYFQLQNVFGKVSTAFHEIGLDAETRQKWNHGKVIAVLKERDAAGKSLSSLDVKREDNKLWSAVKEHFRTWDQGLKAAGFNPAEIKKRFNFTDEQILKMAEKAAQETGELNTSNMKAVSSNFPNLLRSRFGSIQKVADILGVAYERKQEQWTAERVIERIRERHENGQPLSVREILKEASRIHYAAKMFFGTWAKALRAAGLSPDNYNTSDKMTEAEVKAAVREWCKENGPLDGAKLSQSDYRLYRRVCHRFGRMKDTAKACGVPLKKKSHVPKVKWTREKVIEGILREQTLKRISSVNPPLYGAAVRYFGSW